LEGPPSIPSDAELRERLKAADHEEDLLTRKQAVELGPGPCPVCADYPPQARPRPETSAGFVPAPAEAEADSEDTATTQDALVETEHQLPPPSGLRPTSPRWLSPFLSRPALGCDACRAQLPPRLNHAAWLLATLSVLVLALAAVFLVFQAQRLEDAAPRLLAFGGGAFLLAIALSTGYMLHSTGSVTLAARELVRARRRARGDRTLHAPSDWAGETLEAVVISIILALLLRHVAIEAFVIPTGSMAPTLYGDHYEVECPNCGFPFAIGRDDHTFTKTVTLSAVCVQCQQRQRFERSYEDVVGGDKILVNKLCYALRDPERYEVAVFVFPEQPWEHYIKRVIGLPGETITIENGDVFIDGKRARKPDAIQDGTWIPVFDSRYVQRTAGAGPHWETGPEVGRDASAWDTTDPTLPQARPLDPERPPTWIELSRNQGLRERELQRARRSARGIKDDLPYSTSGQGAKAVADLRIRATVRAQATARLGIREDDRIVAASFPVGPGEQTFAIEVDGAAVAQARRPGLTPGGSHEIQLAYADDRARLIVDGELVLAWEDAFAPAATGKAFVGLQADGEVSFDALKVDRDVFYTPLERGGPDPSYGEVDVPEDCFFVLGDNSPHSQDSRAWGYVSREHLVGRAFGVFWPVLPSRVKVIR